MAARTRPATFPAANGGPLLEGVLHLPEPTGPFPAALVCHPHPLMGGTMDNIVVVAVCRALTARGWAAPHLLLRPPQSYGAGLEET
jgi:alpha/beta superfamily hydrolase